MVIPTGSYNVPHDTLTMSVLPSIYLTGAYEVIDAQEYTCDANMTVANTNALLPDSDGLSNGRESSIRTSVTQTDTDGDGTQDGNETYTLRVDDQETEAWLEVTGTGNVSRGVTITRLTENATANGRSSNNFWLDNQRPFQYVEVHLPIDSN